MEALGSASCNYLFTVFSKRLAYLIFPHAGLEIKSTMAVSHLTVMTGNLVFLTLKTVSFKKTFFSLPSIMILHESYITASMMLVLQNTHNGVRKSIPVSKRIYTERFKKKQPT